MGYAFVTNFSDNTVTPLVRREPAWQEKEESFTILKLERLDYLRPENQ